MSQHEIFHWLCLLLHSFMFIFVDIKQGQSYPIARHYRNLCPIYSNLIWSLMESLSLSMDTCLVINLVLWYLESQERMDSIHFTNYCIKAHLFLRNSLVLRNPKLQLSLMNTLTQIMMNWCVISSPNQMHLLLGNQFKNFKKQESQKSWENIKCSLETDQVFHFCLMNWTHIHVDSFLQSMNIW